MGNKAVNFGYLSDNNILDSLKVNDYLRGCNLIEGEDISDYYTADVLPSNMLPYLPKMNNLNLPLAFKSFTYKKLAVGSNKELEKFAYIHLIVSSFCEQIFQNLNRDGLAFCNFDNFDNEDIEDLTDTVNYFSDVLEFRGYFTKVINGELLVINAPYDIDDKSINEITNTFHKNSITVRLTNNIEYKEQEVYRACSELLRLLPNYRDIEDLWLDCKNRLRMKNSLQFKALFHLAYNMLYIYTYLYPRQNEEDEWYFIRNYSVENMNVLVNKMDVDARQRIKQFIEDIADTAFLLDTCDPNQLSVGCEVIVDCMEEVEVLIDSCFTPELKIFKCIDITEDDLDFLCYYLIKSHSELREPITLEEINELDEDEDLNLPMIDEEDTIKEVVATKTKKGRLKRYLPILTLVVVIVAIALSLMLNA